VQFFFKNVSERLVKDYGDDVTVVTTNSYYGPERKIFKKIEPSTEVINGVKVIRFPYRRWHLKLFSFIFKIFGKLSIKKPEWMIFQANGPYSKKMKSYLMKLQADAIGASSSNYYYMQLPLWRRCNFFYYGSIHLNEDESRQVLYPSQLNSINASTLYLANTGYESRRLQQAGVNKDKLFVLGTGVDINDFIVAPGDVDAYRAHLGISANGILIGYVGRIERTKKSFIVSR